MKLVFADEAWKGYLYRQKQVKRMVERIIKLMQEIQRKPFTRVGKPEGLKHALSGIWSRRITDEHRMVYRIEGGAYWSPNCASITNAPNVYAHQPATALFPIGTPRTVGTCGQALWDHKSMFRKIIDRRR